MKCCFTTIKTKDLADLIGDERIKLEMKCVHLNVGIAGKLVVFRTIRLSQLTSKISTV